MKTYAKKAKRAIECSVDALPDENKLVKQQMRRLWA